MRGRSSLAREGMRRRMGGTARWVVVIRDGGLSTCEFPCVSWMEMESRCGNAHYRFTATAKS